MTPRAHILVMGALLTVGPGSHFLELGVDGNVYGGSLTIRKDPVLVESVRR